MTRIDHLHTTSIPFRPDTHHGSVKDVLGDRRLSCDEKRAILSAWASDMYAVESAPGLRAIPGHAAPMRLSDILDALRSLDPDDPPPRGAAAQIAPPAAIRINARATRHVPATAHRRAGRRDDGEMRTAALRAHRNNIRRYKRLLETELTELERQFVTRRIAEEKSAIERLAKSAGGDDEYAAVAARG